MKRILTLDGGGIRGLFSLQILKRVEQEFRDEYQSPKLVLREVFDFFAGTSTGAIIAALLAWGKSVEEVEALYCKHARDMFSPAPWYQRYRIKYSASPMTHFFQEHFCEDDGTPALLGTEKLWSKDTQKYLVIVMRNVTTGHSWQISNNPKAKNYVPLDPECNLALPLWELLRASTAAPTFFEPASITMNEGDEIVSNIFMDGGITPHNNPSLIALLMATLPPYNINWETGPDKIQLVSIGTGHSRIRLEKNNAKRVHLLDQAKYVVPALMHAVAKHQHKICRVLGHCANGKEADGESDDFNQNTRLFTPAEKKFTYVRYNHEFTDDEVAEANQIIKQALNLPERLLGKIFKNNTNQALTLDNLHLTGFFQKIGGAYAAKSVKRKHLFPRKA